MTFLNSHVAGRAGKTESDTHAFPKARSLQPTMELCSSFAAVGEVLLGLGIVRDRRVQGWRVYGVVLVGGLSRLVVRACGIRRICGIGHKAVARTSVDQSILLQAVDEKPQTLHLQLRNNSRRVAGGSESAES